MASTRTTHISFSRFTNMFYRRFVQPRAVNEDTRRRESIFNVLLLGLLALTVVATVHMVVSEIIKGSAYDGLSALTLVPPIALLLGMYMASRWHFRDAIVYCFVALYLLLGTYALFIYGYALPEGLLTYVLVIIISGILISNRAAIVSIAIILVALVAMSYLQLSGKSHPQDLSDLTKPLAVGHIIIYVFFFAIIFLVSWLSNRDVERSLERARRSESALRKERNSLEVKVRERTSELEKAQVEKVIQLQRFAEFGRLSSTLLHDLANPLTSVAIELEQLADTEYSQLVSEARKGIASMERYVTAARLQLRNQSEVKRFNVAAEVRRVEGFLDSKAKTAKVSLEMQLNESLELYGDSVRFNQVIANLVANAIDAYENAPAGNQRRVLLTARSRNKAVVIEVIDDAGGIPEADFARIFEPFYTTKSAERGSGLGLSITKQTVENDFHGTISVSSGKNEGTCFTVKLPKP